MKLNITILENRGKVNQIYSFLAVKQIRKRCHWHFSLFKQRQYVPLTATRKCPLTKFQFDTFLRERKFLGRLVRNPGYNESPGCARNDDRFLPHRLISPGEPEFVLLMTAGPKKLAVAEQKPNKPIVQRRHP